MSHHDVFFHRTPRQVDNNYPPSLADVVVSHNEPPPANLPAIQAQLDALTVVADQEDNGAEQEDNNAEQEENDVTAQEVEDTEQGNPPIEDGGGGEDDGAVIDQANGAETEEPELE